MNRFLALLAFIALPAGAIDTDDLSVHQSRSSGGAKDNAAKWEVNRQQWQRYQAYMAGKGKYFHQHLDPVFVLGLIADDSDERRRLAELYARQEHDRAAQLTAFNHEYLKAFQRLYGDELKMNLTKLEDFYGPMTPRPKIPKPQAGDRIVLFVSMDCKKPCAQAFKRHYRRLKQPTSLGVTLDIYFTGAVTDVAIQGWARQQQIDPKHVRQRTVTLNHDDRHAHYGAPNLPAAFLVRGTQILGAL